ELVGQSAVGREARVVQEFSVSRPRRRRDRIGEELRFPAQAVVERETGGDLPLVLNEERVLLVVNVRRAGGVGRRAAQPRALQIEQQRTAIRSRSGGAT